MRIQGVNFGSRVAFQHQIHNKKYKVAKHIHQYAELVFMLEGSMKITTDDKEEILNAGDAALIFPFQTHSMTSKDVNKIAMYLFSPSIMPNFMQTCSGKTGDGAVFTPSGSTAAVFREKLLDKEDVTLYNVKGLIYLAISDYLEQNQLKDSPPVTGVVSKVIVYMNEHYADHISLESVAQALGYSANYLSHCIKNLYGLNFCSALAHIRIERARYLLSETSKSTTEVCYECGFGSERSFMRHFKEIIGFSPAEYRKKYFTGALQGPKTIFWD